MDIFDKCATVTMAKDGLMNKFTNAVLAFSTLVFLVAGCGVKEGAEFYSLQKQDNRLAESVSNLQVQVNELLVENNRLRIQSATNSQAISFLIEDERKNQLIIQKLLKQASKNASSNQTAGH
jgi:hypothetical protein